MNKMIQLNLTLRTVTVGSEVVKGDKGRLFHQSNQSRIIPLQFLLILFTKKESPAKAFCQPQKTLLILHEYLNTLLHILINEDRETVQYGHTFIWLHKLRHLVVEYSQLTDLGFLSGHSEQPCCQQVCLADIHCPQIFPVILYLQVFVLGGSFSILEQQMVKTIVCGELACQTLEVFAGFPSNGIAGISIIRQFLGVADGFNHGIVDVEFAVVGFVIK